MARKNIGSKIKSAAKNYVRNVKGGAGIVGNALAGAAKNIKRVGTGNQSANALQATTLPGAGKVFTGNTPQQKAKQAREQSIAKGTAANGQSKFTQADKDIRLALKKNNYNQINQTLKPGGTTNKASGTSTGTTGVNLNQSTTESLGGINTSSNESQGTSVNGRQTTGTPTTSVVNAQAIANTQRVTFPTKEDTFVPTINPIAPLDQQKLDVEKASQDNFQSYLDRLAPPPSSADAYNKAQRESGVMQKQQLVTDLTGKLNSIVSQGQQNQLNVVGQGRGIPEAIIGGQQAQFARETAIQALPVQAQLSAAQGDLDAAEEHLNTLFKIYSDDATNEYNYKKGINEAIYNFTDKKNQEKLKEIQIGQDRAYQEKRDSIKEQQDYAQMALSNNQGSLSASISRLNVNSPTYKEDLSKLIGKIKDPVKEANLRKLNMEIAALNNPQSGENENLSSYASQYADTGKLPSPAELKFSGLTIGQVTSFAKQIPKSKGAVVSSLTGTKSNSISAEAEKDFQKLYNVTEMTKRLKELDKKRVGGVLSGVVGKVFGSEDQGEYLTLRKAIVDEMSRMQSGAALTPEEIAVYNDYLPGRYSESFGLGRDSYKKITSFETAMRQKLNNRLSNNGLSIYGYSNVNVGGQKRTVGEVIDIGGTSYRVLPDGTLTDIL